MNTRGGVGALFVVSLVAFPPLIPNEVGISYVQQVVKFSSRSEVPGEEVLSKKRGKGFGMAPSIA